MKNKRTINVHSTDIPISMADHLLFLCKMMEATTPTNTEIAANQVA